MEHRLVPVAKASPSPPALSLDPLVVGAADTATQSDIRTRLYRHLVAGTDVHVLTPDLNVSVRCINGYARKGIEVDLSQGRTDIDLTAIGRHGDLIEAVSVADVNAARQVLGLLGVQGRKVSKG